MTKNILETEFFSLSEIVEDYQGMGSIYLEKELVEAFPKVDLKMIRGLPRLYRRGCPSISQIKKNFAHLPTLKRLVASRFIFEMYPKAVAGKVALLDAEENVRTLLIDRLPNIEFIKDTQKADLVLSLSHVGKCGQLETFHPRSGGYSLGLHFLERGILIPKKSPLKLEQEPLKRWISEGRHFYLADLATPVGGAVYLHALLKSIENDPRDMDIISPDLGWFIEFVQNREMQPILAENFGVQQIEVRFQEKSYVHTLASEGKKIRLFCPGPISAADFRTLIALSEDFVAVKGDASFSEAILADKIYFYDGIEKETSFIKDLMALSENKLKGPALAIMRGIGNAFFAHHEEEEGEWVEESFFQEKEDWISVAHSIGSALQRPEAKQALKNFNAMIAREYSANNFFCQLVNRALVQKKSPQIQQFEAGQMALFLSNQQSFSKTCEKLQILRERSI